MSVRPLPSILAAKKNNPVFQVQRFAKLKPRDDPANVKARAIKQLQTLNNNTLTPRIQTPAVDAITYNEEMIDAIFALSGQYRRAVQRNLTSLTNANNQRLNEKRALPDAVPPPKNKRKPGDERVFMWPGFK